MPRSRLPRRPPDLGAEFPLGVSNGPGRSGASRGTPSGPGFLKIGTIALRFVLLVLGAIIVADLSPGKALVWGFAVACLLLPVWWSAQLRRHAFHPYSFLILNAIQVFAIPALFILETKNPQTPDDVYGRTMLLFGGCLAFCALGYVSRWGPALGRRIPSVVFTHHGRGRRLGTLVPMAAAIYALGWFGRMQRGSIGYSHLPTDLGEGYKSIGFLNDLSSWSQLSYVVILAYLFTRKDVRVRYIVIAATLTALEVTAGGILGGRTDIVLPLLYAALAWAWAGHRMRFWWLATAYVIALLVVGPVVSAYRYSYYRQLRLDAQPSLSTAVTALNGLGEEIERQGGTVTLRDETFGSQGSMVESTMRVMDRVPDDHPFEWGGRFVTDVAQQTIPRVLWPSKPILIQGQRYNKEFFDRDPVESGGTSIAIGLPSEAYLNFGWLGLPFLMLLGVFIRACTVWVSRAPPNEISSLVWLHFVLFFVTHLNANLASYVVLLARTWPAYLLFLIVLYREIPRLRVVRASEAHQGPAPVRPALAGPEVAT